MGMEVMGEALELVRAAMTGEAIKAIEGALAEGDTKYGMNAWLLKPKIKDPLANVLDHTEGAKRHVLRRLNGEMIDPDSGKPALAHVAARALIALQLEIEMFRIPNPDAPAERDECAPDWEDRVLYGDDGAS